MPRRIEEDHADFRDVYAGRLRKALKKHLSNGSIFRTRGDGKRIRVTIPKIDIPHIVFGDTGDGVGRGPGEPGDVIGRDPQPGQDGGKAGQEEGDGIDIDVDIEEVLKFLQDELQLPNLKPKPNETYHEIKIKYNNISRQGPESLRHMRRTMKEALKRRAASGLLDEKVVLPGFAQPMPKFDIIESDKRYRQYNEIKIPSNNAAIFFARDGSGSMNQYRCDIVSDMAWWIDVWIRHFYDRVERRYIWHDVKAYEIDEDNFYRHRYGGGTTCSSALKRIDKMISESFPPEKWNIYILYFGDGENWGNDNNEFVKMLTKFNPEMVNFIGITQVLAWSPHDTLKAHVDQWLEKSQQGNVRTTQIGEAPDMSRQASMYFGYNNTLSEEERDKQIKRSIIELLGSPKAQEASV